MARKSTWFTAPASCSPFLTVTALVFLCSVAVADAHPTAGTSAPSSLSPGQRAGFSTALAGPPESPGGAILQPQTCTQWSVDGSWKLVVNFPDTRLVGKTRMTGRILFQPDASKLVVAINYDDLIGVWGGTGTLVGDRISFPVFKVEEWTGAVKNERLIQGQGTRLASESSPGGSFTWEATPSQPNQVARCIAGSSSSTAPSPPPRPECKGLFMATLFSRGSIDGIGSMERLIDESKGVFTEASLQQAQEAYDRVALDKRFTGLGEEYKRFVSLLEYMAELHYNDGSSACPKLRLFRPVIYKMLLMSGEEVDYSVAAGRLSMYLLMLDSTERCE